MVGEKTPTIGQGYGYVFSDQPVRGTNDVFWNAKSILFGKSIDRFGDTMNPVMFFQYGFNIDKNGKNSVDNLEISCPK